MPANPKRDKLKELIVYLWQIGQNDERLGAVKLNKLLFYADKEAYLKLGRTITGASYQHLAEGPAPRALPIVRSQLLAEGRLRPDPRPRGKFDPEHMEATEQEPVALGAFAPEELAIVHEVVKRFWYLTGMDLSRLSHFEAGWAVTEEGEDIPERSFWLTAAPLNDEQIAYGRKLWQQLHGAA